MIKEQASSESCISDGNPFGGVHFGHLTESGETPPSNHCVTINDRGELSVIRFHPQDAETLPYAWRDEGRDVSEFSTATSAAETHRRHLSYLQQLGAVTWISGIATGACPNFNGIEGVYLSQPVLPPDARCLRTIATTRERIFLRHLNKRYKDWCVSNGETLALIDISHPRQFSRLLGVKKPVLHDVEPRYGSPEHIQIERFTNTLHTKRVE